MLDVPITIVDIDHSRRIGPAPSSNRSTARDQGTATAPANPAPAGEEPSVTSPADGDEVEPAHDPNNASRAEGNIAEIDHTPSIQQSSGRPIMVKSTCYHARHLVLRAKSKLKTRNPQNSSQKIFINENSYKISHNLMLWGPQAETTYFAWCLDPWWQSSGEAMSNWLEIHIYSNFSNQVYTYWNISNSFAVWLDSGAGANHNAYWRTITSLLLH